MPEYHTPMKQADSSYLSLIKSVTYNFQHFLQRIISLAERYFKLKEVMQSCGAGAALLHH
jgi:hypothetical protein